MIHTSCVNLKRWRQTSSHEIKNNFYLCAPGKTQHFLLYRIERNILSLAAELDPKNEATNISFTCLLKLQITNLIHVSMNYVKPCPNQKRKIKKQFIRNPAYEKSLIISFLCTQESLTELST